MALATPAAKRSAGHSTGKGKAMASVSTPVATRPTRTSDEKASKGGLPKRAHSQGCKVQNTAPNM